MTYSFECFLEHVCEVSEVVTLAVKSAVLPSGTYIPGKTSPQVLHFNISIGILISHKYGILMGVYTYWILKVMVSKIITMLMIISDVWSEFNYTIRLFNVTRNLERILLFCLYSSNIDGKYDYEANLSYSEEQFSIEFMIPAAN